MQTHTYINPPTHLATIRHALKSDTVTIFKGDHYSRTVYYTKYLVWGCCLVYFDQVEDKWITIHIDVFNKSFSGAKV